MIYKILKKVSDVCQLLDKSKFPSSVTRSGVTTTSNGDGSITINGTATASNFISCTPQYPKENNGHIFYVCANNTTMSASTWHYELLNQYVAADYGEGVIVQTRASKPRYTGIVFKSGVVFDNVIIKPQIFDLTEMYGAGNEPTTVAEFREKFPNELYDYKPYCFVKSYKNCLTCTTKNLFDIPLVQGYPSNTSYEGTTHRTFTIGTYIIGMTRNNQYAPYYITNISVSKNSILFKVVQSGYGVSVPFLLTVGKTYTVSCKADNNFYPGIGITYYKEDGTLISFTDSEIITNNPVKSFTVPENTYYTLILFYGRTDNEYNFSNIQLEEGSTASEYQPYGYIQSRKKSLICTTKNLFDNIPVKTNYIINSNGEEVATPGFNTYGKMYGNNFTISTNAPVDLTNDDNWLRVCLYNSAGTFITRKDFNFNTRTVVNIADDNIAYIQLCFSRTSFTNYKLQVELGSTATEYHPYGYL